MVDLDKLVKGLGTFDTIEPGPHASPYIAQAAKQTRALLHADLCEFAARAFDQARHRLTQPEDVATRGYLKAMAHEWRRRTNG